MNSPYLIIDRSGHAVDINQPTYHDRDCATYRTRRTERRGGARMWAMTKADHDELTAYRRLGLSPDEIAAKLAYLNDPAPLPFEDCVDPTEPNANLCWDDRETCGLLEDGDA